MTRTGAEVGDVIPPDWPTEMAKATVKGWYINGVSRLASYPELAPFVYYIQEGPFVKIGTSVDPDQRCDQLRRANPRTSSTKLPMTWGGHPVLLAYHHGNAHVERAMHRKFADKRAEGEWFLLDDELEEHINEVSLQQVFDEIAISEVRRKEAFDHYGLEDNKDYQNVFNQHLMSSRSPDMEYVEEWA